MSEYPFGLRPRRRPSARGRALRAALALVVAGVVFALGVALGKALNDHPRPGPAVTYVRTLEPLPQQPAG